MIEQSDIADIIGKLADSPVRGTAYKRQLEALFRHYHRLGKSLETVRDDRHLGLSEVYAKQYAREFGLVFSDYVPRAMRPKKEGAASK